MKLHWAICFAGMIPYVCKLAYLHVAWKSSPLDTPDIVFLPLALVSIALGVYRDRRYGRGTDPGWDWRALWVMIPSAAVFGIAAGYSVNAIQVLSAVVFGWSAWWLSRTWISARRASRGFAIVALTTTSVTYWLMNLTGLEVWMVQTRAGQRSRAPSGGKAEQEVRDE